MVTGSPDPIAVQDLFDAVRRWMVRVEIEEANKNKTDQEGSSRILPDPVTSD